MKPIIKTRTALVVFTKTPGYLEPKTRLAKEVGVETARKVHQYLFDETSFLVSQLEDSIDVFWSCAEKEALLDPLWEGRSLLWDDEPTLKEKVSSVVNRLLDSYLKVLVIGTDCPFLEPHHVELAKQSLDSCDQVLGPTRDGGFYLFGSRERLPRKEWSNTLWGKSETANQVLALFSKENVQKLDPLIDIDTLKDLQDFMVFKKGAPGFQGSPLRGVSLFK